MSHKNKICNVALATHIETCFTGFSYTPLILNSGLQTERYFEKVGLRNVVEADVAQVLSKLNTESPDAKEINELAKKFVLQGKNALCELTDVDLNADILTHVEKIIEKEQMRSLSKKKKHLLKESKLALDLKTPFKTLMEREEVVYSKNKLEDLIFQPAEKFEIKKHWNYELPQLGMFFTEETCFRPEGLTYSPCGQEKTILSNESISETLVLNEEVGSEVTEAQEVTDTQSSKTTIKESLKLTNSYEQKIKKTLDLKKSIKGSVKGKLFKVLDVGLSSTTSVDFSYLMESISKSSREQSYSLINEVANELIIKSSYESKNTYKLSQTISKTRAIENPTSKPVQYISRDSYCVNSIILKRTNVQLAWSDCIDSPGKDLCRPDNLTEVLSEEIKNIKDKWSTSPAPAIFGSRPGNQSICTASSTVDKRGLIFGDNVQFDETIVGLVPPNGAYISGSAIITVLNSDTDVVSRQVLSQPGSGASGNITFSVKIVVNNKFLNKEWVTYKVCFEVSTAEATAYDNAVNQWRNEQAESEIADLLANEKDKLNDFLLSDKAASVIEKRIFEDFFALTTIDDCCKLIRHIKRIFDFDKLCFSLEPSWDTSGTGCQTADPVSIYTAKCLKFYLPIKEGQEWRALTTLLSINAIPSSSSVLNQIHGYINQINDLRSTVFNRAFNPAGWDVKIDSPNGYNLTPYDTIDDVWNTEFETKLNFQLIDVHTVAIPTGSVRVDLRSDLCT